MTAISSTPALTAAATQCRVLKNKASPYVAQDVSQAMLQPLILELSVRISRRAALLEMSPGNTAQVADDLAALAWIQRSLEDVEATIIGLCEVNRRRSAAFQGLASSPAGSPHP